MQSEIIFKSGNNRRTYTCSDIALVFASWLSPEFKLYVIQEFERLKRNEAYQYKVDWTASRMQNLIIIFIPIQLKKILFLG